MLHVASLAIVALLLLIWSPRPALAGDVTIYRCVDSQDKLSLRDTPCNKGERQQMRTMARPKEAEARAVTPARPVVAQQPDYDTRPRVIVPPRPMYECTTFDGEHYTSENAEGNPRWVPLWTLGYPAFPMHRRQQAGVDFHAGNRNGEISGGRRFDPGLRHPAARYGAGTWIRDTCYALPQGEVCDRLIDRRDEIRRRFFNAMPSERDVLRVEERGINARLDNDCGAH